MAKTTKKVESVTEELKDTEVVDEKKATTKKKAETVKKATTKKKAETEKKTATKKKTTTKKADEKTTETAEKKTRRTRKKKIEAEFFVEYPGRQVSQKAIMDKFVEVWEKDRKLSEVKDLRVYFNVEESTAYFVVNDAENFGIYID